MRSIILLIIISFTFTGFNMLNKKQDYSVSKGEQLVNDVLNKAAKTIKEKYNIKSINVAHNFIHASSGPFDAVFEICNFVGNIKEISYCKYNTNVYNLMTYKYNLDAADYEKCLKNPKVEIDNLQTDLFSLTKNKNTFEAIDIYIKYFKNLKNSYKKENKSA